MQACNAHDSHTWKNVLKTVMKNPHGDIVYNYLKIDK